MGKTFLLAFALMLIFEGILPFAAPARWRSALIQLIRLADNQLRFFGLTLMLLGLVLLLLFS